MKINIKSRHRVLALSTVGLVSVVLLAWKHEPVYRLGDTIYYSDTVPSRSQLKVGKRDLDKELEDLDKAIENLKTLSSRDLEALHDVIDLQTDNIDFDKIGRETALALAEINIPDISADVNAALIEIDIPAINGKIHDALRGLDLEALKADLKLNLKESGIKLTEIDKALDEASKELSVELKASGAEIDRELAKASIQLNNELKEANIQLKNELADIKQLNTKEIQLAFRDIARDIRNLKEDLREELPSINIDFGELRAKLEEARLTLKGYQQMIYSMEAEGILNTKTDYKIERINGDFFIDDVKQSESISDRYKKYLDEHVTIQKIQGKLKISHNKRLPD